MENSSWIISQILNSEGISILENFNVDIDNAVRDFVIPYANDFLANVTPKQFLNIIEDMSVNSYVIDESDKSIITQ